MIRPTLEGDELTSIEVSTSSEGDQFDFCPKDASARTKVCLIAGSVVVSTVSIDSILSLNVWMNVYIILCVYMYVCLRYQVNRNAEIKKIGALDINDRIKLSLSNSKTFSKITVKTPWIDCQIHVVLPPLSWQVNKEKKGGEKKKPSSRRFIHKIFFIPLPSQIPDSELEDFTHIDFQIDRLRIADRLSIHGVIGQTANNRVRTQKTSIHEQNSEVCLKLPVGRSLCFFSLEIYIYIKV